ncbi:MAG TPA: proprotein convertase P-domain-containing protein [Thermoleophilaceae bacterium]|nr:proprotein convertase P-domain-containing protein [Thermoleophilaceae bacterium]
MARAVRADICPMRNARIGAAIVALLVGAATPAEAAAPPTPPGCGTAGTRTVVDEIPRPIPDDGTITPTLEIAGAGRHLRDADVQTSIAHTFAADLDVVLVSPSGTQVTLTADNAEDRNNVFRGTLWDDDAGDSNPPGPVTDNVFQNNVAESPLVPEEAMGAFIGEDPNGTWTLRVADDNSGDTGTLERWSIAVTTCTAAPPAETAMPTQGTPLPVADSGTSEATLAVGGIGSYLLGLDLTTRLSHSFGGDLEVTLVSPAGTAVTVTSDNGGGADDVFRGTVWADSAGDANPPGPVTLGVFEDGVAESPLVPEEAMGAFIGENPNGTWTLRIEDDQAGDMGVLESWSLAARTEPFTIPPDTTAPAISRMAVRPRAFRRRARIDYRLSEAATVRFQVQRATAGRRVRGRCVPATRRTRRPRRCRRFVRFGRSFTQRGRSGANRRRLSRRAGGRLLRPAVYRLVGRATDPAGNRSARRSAGFRVRRR